ncbi:hypothetical protein C6P45_003577 [Maudiozyma exigua]|uniref:Receptor L-domain domain-containing protein n=1 Tax=Maudiozyma exigua TaxID=34358 RepID=A0A9P7BAC1_MAUEX|nr:hypothetical protein C6P45_003577 [Kazachstania exigua]
MKLKYNIFVLNSLLITSAFASYLLNHELIGKISEAEVIAMSTIPNNQELCHKKNHELNNQDEINILARTCHEVVGNVEILKDYQDKYVDLSDIEKIHGDLSVHDCSQIISLNAPRLDTIGGGIKIKDLTSLVSITVPSLQNVHNIEFVTLPLLKDININRDIEQLDKLIISDTSLQSIESFQNVKKVNTLEINNNRYLANIDLHVDIVNEKLHIYSNADQAQVNFAKLSSTGDLSIRNAGSFNLNNLEYINKSLDIIENSIDQINLTKLKKVVGTVAIIDNDNLKDVNCNNLTHIEGGLLIINNDNLKNMDFLPSIHTIGGAIQIDGTFHKVTFEKLKVIKGGANFRSQSDKFNCTELLEPLMERHVIRGENLTCSSNMKNQSNLNQSNVTKISYNKTKTGKATGMKESMSSQTEITKSDSSAPSTTENSSKTGKVKSKKNSGLKLTSINIYGIGIWFLITFIFFSMF